MPSSKAVVKIVFELLPAGTIARYDADYSARLLVQKAIFMFQELNNIKGFNYNWYVAGPYSPELTSQVYNQIIPNIASVMHAAEQLEINETARTRINRVKDFFRFDEAIIEANNLTLANWYELMASAHYLRSRRKIETKDDLIEQLKQEKDKFSPGQIRFVVDNYWDRMI
jgi:uncharacterized protein YwgA